MITISCNTLEDTDRLASVLSSYAFEGFLVLASGDLGAGKTRLAKAIAKELGVKETVTSPTFNILKCYTGNKYDFYHIDAYRLEGMNQDLGLEEFIEGDGVCFIEWSEFIEYMLPSEYLKINITISDNEKRIVNISSKGDRYEKIEKEINRLW